MYAGLCVCMSPLPSSSIHDVFLVLKETLGVGGCESRNAGELGFRSLGLMVSFKGPQRVKWSR